MPPPTVTRRGPRVGSAPRADVFFAAAGAAWLDKGQPAPTSAEPPRAASQRRLGALAGQSLACAGSVDAGTVGGRFMVLGVDGHGAHFKRRCLSANPTTPQKRGGGSRSLVGTKAWISVATNGLMRQHPTFLASGPESRASREARLDRVCERQRTSPWRRPVRRTPPAPTPRLSGLRAGAD